MPRQYASPAHVGAEQGDTAASPGDLWWLLIEVANLSRRLTERRLASFHTTTDQIHALRVIALREPMTVGELAGALGLEQNSGSQLVERLVRRGLVSRDRASHDRRQALISVSAGGRALLQAGEPDAAALADELLSELPPDLIAQSATLLRRVRANADRRILGRAGRNLRRSGRRSRQVTSGLEASLLGEAPGGS